MRIAFVGKGGVGKTTFTALFSNFLSKQGIPVLAIDADINQHLGAALGIGIGSSRTLSEGANDIKRLLKGNNRRIASSQEMIKTSPAGNGSRLLRFSTMGLDLRDYISQNGSLSLIRTGDFDPVDIGLKCYHSKTGLVELLLNHFIDSESEYIVVDMTAGSDAFASGLFTKFDLTVFIVEPTERSFDVYNQYLKFAEPFSVKTAVLVNKVIDESDQSFVARQKIDKLIGLMPYQKNFRDNTPADDESAFKICHSLYKEAGLIKRDWLKMEEQIRYFHIKNANGWANDSLKKDLTSQIDYSFSLQEAA